VLNWGEKMNRKRFMNQKVNDMSIEELKQVIEYKKQKVKNSIVFEDSDRKCEVRTNGSIKLSEKRNNAFYIVFDAGLPVLYKAVDLSKKIRNKNGKRI